MSTRPTTTVAPADVGPHGRWRWWEKVLAYLILAALAACSIWLVDRDATGYRQPASHFDPPSLHAQEGRRNAGIDRASRSTTVAVPAWARTAGHTETGNV